MISTIQEYLDVMDRAESDADSAAISFLLGHWTDEDAVQSADLSRLLRVIESEIGDFQFRRNRVGRRTK